MSPCLFKLHAKYVMRNAGLGEAQAGIKIVGRNINNSDTQVTPPLWQKVKTLEPLDETGRGELRTGLKLSIQKAKIMASGPITS